MGSLVVQWLRLKWFCSFSIPAWWPFCVFSCCLCPCGGRQSNWQRGPFRTTLLLLVIAPGLHCFVPWARSFLLAPQCWVEAGGQPFTFAASSEITLLRLFELETITGRGCCLQQVSFYCHFVSQWVDVMQSWDTRLGPHLRHKQLVLVVQGELSCRLWKVDD